MRNLSIVPSLNCPAKCDYCFGPHENGSLMTVEMIQAIACWQKAIGITRDLHITFHGGEPLTAPAKFYRVAMPLLRKYLSPTQLHFHVQSNLWLLTNELCDIFSSHNVSIGTSLDGTEHINDAQRSSGYFQRTMEGIELARYHGLVVGCVCTFTNQSMLQAEEIFDFFVSNKLPFTIQPALRSLRNPRADWWQLSPEAHAALLKHMLELYLDNLDKIHIHTLDMFCQSISAQKGGLCTLSNCLGNYLAVGPIGDIYPCQRFIGMTDYCMGNVYDCPSMEMLSRSSVWIMFKDRQDHINEACEGCPNLKFCRGGCPYDVLAANGGTFEHTLRDPQCHAYQDIFAHIVDMAIKEVFSDKNMSCVIDHVDSDARLLRSGRLLSIMSDKCLFQPITGDCTSCPD